MIDTTKVPGLTDPYSGGAGAGNANIGIPEVNQPSPTGSTSSVPDWGILGYGKQHEITPEQWSAWGGGEYQPGWYRRASDPMHMVANQQYGYQNWPDVYKQGFTPTANWDMSGFQTPERNKANYVWQDGKYVPKELANQGTQTGGQGEWAKWFSQFFSGGQPQTGPEDIGPVYDWLSPMNKATDIMGGIAESGSPVDYSGWWGANLPKMQRTIEDQSKNAAEMMGLGGMRWSTPLQRNITDITGRETNSAWSDFAKMSLGGQEAAKQRQLQAAGALPGISQAGYGIQSNIANALMGAGQGATNFNQQQLGNLLNLWGQNNPTLQTWLQSALGGLGGQSNFAQQQYSPSWLSQLFGGLGSALPFML